MDTANDWVRMECTDGFSEKSQQQLTSVKDLFIHQLPIINSSSLVISGQFNFSCNDNINTIIKEENFGEFSVIYPSKNPPILYYKVM